ncbi:hypothetical protein [Rhodococcus marinonascens]|uniref:hypothetical protein n=1 Tax=Rhodococcus marinonascens TaxID=38311 RepID=UPI0009345660|nr:hypothetical protein [Rhodococcus marinonascens]
MNDDHAQVMEELRVLAESVLDRLEPIVRRAAAPHPQESGEEVAADTSQRSGCTWCPVCALAALIRGEQHELVTLLAGQASVLIVLLRQILDEHRVHGAPGPDGAGASSSGATEGTTDAEPARGPAFVPITVRVADPASAQSSP